MSIDIIPVNPIGGVGGFLRPSDEALAAFTSMLRRVEPRLHVAVRLTRGDDENGACGQLATTKLPTPQVTQIAG